MDMLEIQVPCRRFKIEVEVGAIRGFGVIDQHILRAVAAGVHTLAPLVALLALPEKMIVDACVGLISAGHLLFLEDGALSISEELADKMGDPGAPTEGWAQAARSNRAGDRRAYTLLQELLTGAVFCFSRDYTELKIGGARRVPESDGIEELSVIPWLTFKQALGQIKREEGGEPLHILKIDLARHAGPIGQAGVDFRRWDLVVRVRLQEAGSLEEGRAPRFLVTAPASLPSWVRVRLQQGLAQRWLERDDGVFNEVFEQLNTLTPITSKGEETHDVLDLAHRVRLAEHFEEDLSRVKQAPVDELFDWHARAHASMDGVDVVIGAHLERPIKATPLPGRGAAFEAMLDALREASVQVVLVCPWVKLWEKHRLDHAIENALARGVDVFLLWGIAMGDQLERETRTSRASPNHGRLFVSEFPSKTHAKVIMCDMAWAVLTSHNFMNTQKSAHAEFGVRLEASGEESSAQLLQDVLLWTGRHIPDHVIRPLLRTDPADFQVRWESLATLEAPEEVNPPNRNHLLFGRETALGAWERGWRARFEHVFAASAMVESSALLIEDGPAHVDWMLHACEHASRRLLLASHKLSSANLHARFVERLVELSQRGVSCVLVFNDEEALDPGREEAFEVLEKAGVRLIKGDTHAKALVCDDGALVTSHNFLSRRAGGARELGVYVHDSDFANACWKMLMGFADE